MARERISRRSTSQRNTRRSSTNSARQRQRNMRSRNSTSNSFGSAASKFTAGTTAIIAITLTGIHFYQQGLDHTVKLSGGSIPFMSEVTYEAEIRQNPSYFLPDEILGRQVPALSKSDLRLLGREQYQTIDDLMTIGRHNSDYKNGVTYVDLSDSFRKWLEVNYKGDLAIIYDEPFKDLTPKEARTVIAIFLASANSTSEFNERYDYFYDVIRNYQKQNVYPFADKNGKDLIGLALWSKNVPFADLYRRQDGFGLGALYREAWARFKDNNPGLAGAINDVDSSTFDDSRPGEIILGDKSILFQPDFKDFSASLAEIGIPTTSSTVLSTSMDVLSQRWRTYKTTEKPEHLLRYNDNVLATWFAAATYMGTEDTRAAEQTIAARNLIALDLGEYAVDGTTIRGGENYDIIEGYKDASFAGFGNIWIASGRTPVTSFDNNFRINLNNSFQTVIKMTDTSGYNIKSQFDINVKPQLAAISTTLQNPAFNNFRLPNGRIDWAREEVRDFFKQAADISGAPILEYIDLNIDVLNTDGRFMAAQPVINKLTPYYGLKENEISRARNSMWGNLTDQADTLRKSTLADTYPAQVDALARGLEQARILLDPSSIAITLQERENKKEDAQPVTPKPN